VACGAGDEASDSVIVYEFPADLRLISGRLILHVENQLARAYILLWVAMTVQAPLHRERFRLPRQRHAVDAAVTRGASNTFTHVDIVRKVDISRQIVNPGPFDRAAGAEAFAYGREHLAGGPHLRMTVHADPGGGNPREARLLDGCMTVPAVDAQSAGMMFVTERNRLLARDVLQGFVR